MIPHTFKKLYKRKGVTHPCMVVEETENISHEIKRSQNNHLLQQIYLLLFPYWIQRGFLGTRSTWAICSAATWHQQSLAHPGFGHRKGTRQGEKKHRQSWPAALSTTTRSQIQLGYYTALISRYEFKVSLDALTENWHCLHPAVSTTSNQGSQLLLVILFIIAGPQDKQKRSPIVLSVVQKCLIRLYIGCSLELLLNKVSSSNL